MITGPDIQIKLNHLECSNRNIFISGCSELAQIFISFSPLELPKVLSTLKKRPMPHSHSVFVLCGRTHGREILFPFCFTRYTNGLFRSSSETRAEGEYEEELRKRLQTCLQCDVFFTTNHTKFWKQTGLSDTLT
jgi:hypothetical protein